MQYENHIAAILNDPDFPDSYPLNEIYYFEFSCKYASLIGRLWEMEAR